MNLPDETQASTSMHLYRPLGARLSLSFRAALLVGSFLSPTSAHAATLPGEPVPVRAQTAAEAAAAAAEPAPVVAPAPAALPAPARRGRLPRACRVLAADSPPLSEAVSALERLQSPFAGLRLSGLSTLKESDLLAALGAPGGGLSLEQAQATAIRLWSTGAFAGLTPSLTAGGVLVLTLEEHPVVRTVRLRGLEESQPEDLLTRLLEAPWESASTTTERKHRSRRSALRDDDDDDDRAPGPCDALALPRALFARFERDQVRGGVIHRGLVAALERTARTLFDDGYLLARVEARLDPKGELVVEVDEGRVESLEVRGLEPRLRAEVERALGIRRGSVFSSAELRRSLARLSAEFPFVEPVRRGGPRPKAPSYAEQVSPDGSRTLTPTLSREEAQRGERDPEGAGWSAERRREHKRSAEDGDDGVAGVKRRAADADREREEHERGRFRTASDSDDDWPDLSDLDFSDFSDGDWNWGNFKRHGETLLRRARTSSVQVLGPGRIAVWMKARTSDFDGQGASILRHTPVTGFAPGVSGTLRFWDPADRAHLSLDGAIAWNSRRHSWDAAPGASFFERAGAAERMDWLVGLRLAIPALRVAEVGVQAYALTDTADRWRMPAGDSYLFSALFNRPESDYFRRSGATALLTLHPLEGLTLGGEVRLDRVWGLNPPGKVWTLFNGDEAALPPALVTAGEFGSFLARLEWTTEAQPLHRVGGLWRDPERSIARAEEPMEHGFSTVTTLEVGSPALTGGTGARWTRLVSDNVLVLEFGDRRWLRLRGRGATSSDAPLHKQEALGGFGALRGYDFKELRGDSSLLGTLELRSGHWGGFLDVGSVRQHDGWIGAKAGAGAQFFFDRNVRFEFAWRLDGRAEAMPAVRLLLGWEL
jgi:hypothetical protein